MPTTTTASGIVIGRAVADGRIRRGLTQNDLAAACGFSVRTLGKIERGDMSPSIDKLLRIASHLGCDPHFGFAPADSRTAPEGTK